MNARHTGVPEHGTGAVGWRAVEIEFEDPEGLSFLTARIYDDWYREHGIDARRLVVDSFVLMDPLRTLRLHALPLCWSSACCPRATRSSVTLIRSRISTRSI